MVDADGYHGGLRHSAASSPKTSANRNAAGATNIKNTIQGRRSTKVDNPWTDSYNNSPPVDPHNGQTQIRKMRNRARLAHILAKPNMYALRSARKLTPIYTRFLTDTIQYLTLQEHAEGRLLVGLLDKCYNLRKAAPSGKKKEGKCN